MWVETTVESGTARWWMAESCHRAGRVHGLSCAGGPNGDIFAWHKALVAAATAVHRATPLFINNCHNSVQDLDPDNDSVATRPPNTDQVPYLHEDEVNMTGRQLLVCPMHSWRISHDMNPSFIQAMAQIQGVLPFRE